MCVCMYIYIYNIYISGLTQARGLSLSPRVNPIYRVILGLTVNSCGADAWPLHDIAIPNIVWCMAYQREVEGGSCIAQ